MLTILTELTRGRARAVSESDTQLHRKRFSYRSDRRKANSSEDADTMAKRQLLAARRASTRSTTNRLNFILANFCVARPRRTLKLPSARSSLSATSSIARRTANETVAVMIIRWCIDTIEAEEDCKIKGMYVRNGRFSSIQQIEKAFDKGATPSVAPGMDKYDCRAVGGFLKRFIRRADSFPIFPDWLFDELVEACNDYAKTKSCVKLRYVIRKLPLVNYDIAKLLISHFWRLTNERSLHLVTPIGLAISWTPNFFDMDSLTGHLKSSELAVYEASLAVAIRNFITETIITTADVLFKE